VVHILIVEDDAAVAGSLDVALTRDGYSVSTSADGSTAVASMRGHDTGPDLLVLDVMLPGLDGLEVCRRIRANGDRTPILMLTARDLVGDRIAGLDAGADDYLAKPFALDELRARVRALLRRVGHATGSLSFEGLRMDLDAAQVWYLDQPVMLTRTEYALLEMFLRHPGQVLSRRQIGLRIWGYDLGTSSNTLWVHLSYLRGKLESAGSPRLIRTVRGLGYVLRKEP
jgi:two-component system, OmpR family, response regulator MprA